MDVLWGGSHCIANYAETGLPYADSTQPRDNGREWLIKPGHQLQKSLVRHPMTKYNTACNAGPRYIQLSAHTGNRSPQRNIQSPK